ncbi:prepilin-type N-terminal cleavage/methylation domain-containing protein [Oceanobacillus piezotolerans]|uniref:Prepilin-type N-terminal cleavage/methylation domain-containing protein n=1 Tax=Oceanobacillus piezotolerans TaxID=2448030 RepID=A0A498DEB4_9BACI|nr:prepilin-type N-terminal cleavage/methylation domain-containing protein [Oceanobacillus piezotolerans]RLL47865.1 prepilin-type N-terminal cleavage/methylation domain-containing protein [Oceanobacillus piezotolerans]
MKKWLDRLKKDERGLTLVELLAVIVILAIVGAIAFVAVGNVIENSKKDAHVANAQQLISAAKLYEASNGEIPVGGISTDDVSFDTVGELTNPWKADDSTYKGTVKKEDGVYYVTITGVDIKLTITDVSEDKILQGREAIENNTETTSPADE